jgi:hypothetical protein
MYTLSDEECDKIVVDSLKESHRIASLNYYDEGSELLEADIKVIKALETVLSYYMTAQQFAVWKG